MKLYGYYRSSASYRVRIALNYKHLDYAFEAVNLLNGEHKKNEYLAINPQGFVPALQVDDTILTQSPAILDWLEERHPQHSLYPSDTLQKAQLKALCNIIACDIHPIDNLRVLKYLSTEFDATEQEKQKWYRHWIQKGFSVLEPHIHAAPYSSGDSISMLDVYLIPQVYNALRFEQDMTDFPNIMRAYENCNTLKPFIQARPENQPDCPK